MRLFVIVFRDERITENYIIGALDAVSMKPVCIEGNRVTAEGSQEGAQQLDSLPGIVSVEEMTLQRHLTAQ